MVSVCSVVFVGGLLASAWRNFFCLLVRSRPADSLLGTAPGTPSCALATRLAVWGEILESWRLVVTELGGKLVEGTMR